MSAPAQKIYEMLCLAASDSRTFPATIFYNEGWLLRLVLDWFSRHSFIGHPLDFASRARWYSEALLPSQFLPRYRGDLLGEGWTHADGVVGHVVIGNGAIANTTLAGNSSQFVVTEAKLFSPLSTGVRHAPTFDQAARNVACIAEVLSKAVRPPDQFLSLGFFVIAPREQIDRHLFRTQVSKDSIQDKVEKRVEAYEAKDRESKTEWLRRWFMPTLSHIKVDCLAWEDIIGDVRRLDSEFGLELVAFYENCIKFNRMQEPEV